MKDQCPDCHGEGFLYVVQHGITGSFTLRQDCPKCAGYGIGHTRPAYGKADKLDRFDIQEPKPNKKPK